MHGCPVMSVTIRPVASFGVTVSVDEHCRLIKAAIDHAAQVRPGHEAHGEVEHALLLAAAILPSPAASSLALTALSAWAIVTGAQRGLGFAIAKGLAEAGALVLAGQVRVGEGDAARTDLKAGDFVETFEVEMRERTL